MNNRNPIIEWSEISGKECLRFTFGENLTVDEAVVAVAEWKKCFKEKTDKPIILLWDCSKMERYEPAAKEKWTTALKDMKTDIESIWLITDNRIIRFGAYVMSIFSSMKIQTVNSEDEILI